MECDRYQHLLIDIACGEPHTADLAQARLHAEGCSACGALLSKLQRGAQLTASLPLAEPSQAVSDRIMRDARAHVLAVRALNPHARRTQPVASLAERVREFLGQFAMGRQVAMATVMVLVVAVGLWFVPKARHHELAGGNIVNPDPEGEAGPSDGIVPAAPLDLDLRQGRIRTRGEGPEPTTAREISATVSPAPEPSDVAEVTAAAPAPQAEPGNEKSAPEELDDNFTGAATVGVAPAAEAHDPASATLSADVDYAEAEMERKGRSRTAVVPAADTIAPTADEALAAPEAFAQRAPAASAPSAPPSPARRSAAREIAPSPYGGFAPPPAPAASTSSAAGAGLGSATEAVSEESTTHDAPKGVDTLALARSAQRNGQCADAVVYYEAYLRTAPRNRTVMLEAAACYRQLGRQADATRWTTRANAIAAPTAPKSAVRKTEPTVPAQAQ